MIIVKQSTGAFSAVPTSPTTPVNIRIMVLRWFGHDNQIQIRQINSTRADVSGDHDLNSSLLELVHGLVALLLRDVAVDHGRAFALQFVRVSVQTVVDFADFAFHLAEDDDFADFGAVVVGLPGYEINNRVFKCFVAIDSHFQMFDFERHCFFILNKIYHFLIYSEFTADFLKLLIDSC
jgi:hypothetical protein